ncbi:MULTISPECIES: KPN_02809 family neutral zinc metallopeptidase [unclassified Mucilaginibacter]|uniref:KPN_02809 family neutral zinc metallopeptidase n=1 Tax=unclassified Mucilaginibacter TaxID=2617802 RepID=UPI000961DCFA|nr:MULTISPECIES: neutral zinc metallopeptidase [unclassified Mucilaginibacter]OJW17540.1 MAG: metalloprotease [Mucilaginibacter sp. 44-25]PLW89804.1 MAG: metalloprotease [Mucilaginibacter sp.]HEK18908.1 metalloprotease [Bacteroidota bacterium]
MQWFGRRESSNTEDGSASGGRGIALGGGVIGIIAAAIYYFTGVDPSAVLNGLQQGGGQQGNNQEVVANTKEKKFAKVVFADTEDVWNKLFSDMGRTYEDPTLHFYQEAVNTACGTAGAEVGPFYCPGDQKVYLDLSFFKELSDKFGAAGDFAQAYVIAHEVGHHVQYLLGVSQKMDQARQQLSKEEYNKLSVKLELQADFYAGVWAYYEKNLKNVLDPGDIEEALNAAHQIGDDRLQKEFQGEVHPDSFTHGSSAQRMYWFKKGYETGDPKQGNTFAAADLE